MLTQSNRLLSNVFFQYFQLSIQNNLMTCRLRQDLVNSRYSFELVFLLSVRERKAKRTPDTFLSNNTPGSDDHSLIDSAFIHQKTNADFLPSRDFVFLRRTLEIQHQLTYFFLLLSGLIIAFRKLSYSIQCSLFCNSNYSCCS